MTEGTMMTETVTTEAQLTKAQFEVCRALAARHDHEWAMGDLTCPDGGISLEEIARHTAEDPANKWGIQTPYVVKGVVQHTMSRSDSWHICPDELSWHVWPDGEFTLEVSRLKLGKVLCYNSGLRHTAVFPHARVRHAQTIIDCLRALGVAIPAKLMAVRDVGGAEILRRLARLETLPSDLSVVLEDIWTNHKEGPDYQPTSAEIEQRASRRVAEYEDYFCGGDPALLVDTETE